MDVTLMVRPLIEELRKDGHVVKQAVWSVKKLPDGHIVLIHDRHMDVRAVLDKAGVLHVNQYTLHV